MRKWPLDLEQQNCMRARSNNHDWLANIPYFLEKKPWRLFLIVAVKIRIKKKSDELGFARVFTSRLWPVCTSSITHHMQHVAGIYVWIFLSTQLELNAPSPYTLLRIHIQ